MKVLQSHPHPDLHIDCLLGLDSLQHAVQQDEGPSATNTCTAVHQQWDTFIFVVGFLDPPDEGNEGGGKLWHSVVWPGREVVLGD